MAFPIAFQKLLAMPQPQIISKHVSDYAVYDYMTISLTQKHSMVNSM